jgi:hypothetical protein
LTEFSRKYQKTLRQSTINQILKCAHQYELRQLHGNLPPGIAALSGSSVHEAAEYNHVQKIKTGQDEPLSVLKDCAEQAFHNRLKNEGVYILEEEMPYLKRIIEDGKQRAFGCITGYHKKIAPSIRPVEEFTEREIIVDIGLELPIGSKYDTADSNDNLFDLKTSARPYQDSYIKKAAQPTHYSMAYNKVTGRYPAFHTVVLMETGEYQILSIQKSDDDFARHKLLCKTVIDVINSGVFPPCNPDPKMSWWCQEKFCGYYNICQYSAK